MIFWSFVISDWISSQLCKFDGSCLKENEGGGNSSNKSLMFCRYLKSSLTAVVNCWESWFSYEIFLISSMAFWIKMLFSYWESRAKRISLLKILTDYSKNYHEVWGEMIARELKMRDT